MNKKQLEAQGYEVRSKDLRNAVIKGKNLALRTGADTCSLNVRDVAVRIAENRSVREIIDIKKSVKNPDLKVFVDPFGGAKIVEIWKDGDMHSDGIAHCSNQDRFNKKVGFKIALGRAVKELKN